MPRVVFLALLGLCACGGSDGGTDEVVPRIVRASPTDPTVGARYSNSLSVEGVSEAVRWHLVDGTLPPGLGLGVAGSCPDWAGFDRTGTLDQSLGGTALREVSGIAVSRHNEGVYWVHDDSGAQAHVHALNEDGSHRQTYRIDVGAVDWEDLALGPGPNPSVEYLYVADVGDNGTNRATVRLLRIAEPTVPAVPEPTRLVPHEAFHFTYPGGAIDVEALLVDWATGTPYLLEKNESAGGNVYKLPMPLAPAWTEANPTTAIPVTSHRPLPPFVTAADASRCGLRAVVRTYVSGREYLRLPAASFDALFSQPPCRFTVPGFQQFEAIAYDASGWGLVTTSEQVFDDSGLFTSVATVLSPTVELRGTPTAAGSFSFEVEAEHPDGTKWRAVIAMEVRP